MKKVKDKLEIIIADDHMMIREGLKQLLELDGTMKVIAEANDGEECLNLLSKKILCFLILIYYLLLYLLRILIFSPRKYLTFL